MHIIRAVHCRVVLYIDITIRIPLIDVEICFERTEINSNGMSNRLNECTKQWMKKKKNAHTRNKRLDVFSLDANALVHVEETSRWNGYAACTCGCDHSISPIHRTQTHSQSEIHFFCIETKEKEKQLAFQMVSFSPLLILNLSLSLHLHCNILWCTQHWYMFQVSF